ncbi:hypothetical protein Tco_0576832 [Tanacetum coccineum]
MKRVNTFVDYRTELVEESSKKAEQKVEEDKETAKLKQYLEIIPDDGDDVTIDATPVSSKSPTIMYWTFNVSTYKEHTTHVFNDVKLQVDYECEMAFELLRLVKKQLKEGYVPQLSVWKHPPGD